MSFRLCTQSERQDYLLRIKDLQKRIQQDSSHLKRLQEELKHGMWVNDMDFRGPAKRLELLGYSKDTTGCYTIYKGVL